MDVVELGRTSLSVSRLGLGGLWLESEADARATVGAAVDLGITYFDTAPAYPRSEQFLGAAFRDIAAPLVVSTKLGGRPDPFDPRNVAALVESARRSLELLGRDRIDILMLHEPDRALQYDWWTNPTDYDGPVWDAIDQLRSDGLVKWIGIGGTTATELGRLCASGRFDVVLTAFNFSLLWREAEQEIFPLARRHGMGIVCGSPLQGGALAARRDDVLRTGAPWLNSARREQLLKLGDLCDELGMDIAELALRFVAHSGRCHVTLTGARDRRELEQNVAAYEAGPLDDAVLERIDAIAAMVPFRPTLEPFILPFGEQEPRQGPLR